MTTWTYLSEGPTTTDGTEQDLASSTTKGHYGLFVDLAWMVSGDTVIIRLYEEVGSNGSITQRVLDEQTFTGAQDPSNMAWPPVQLGENSKWTLEHSVGTTGETVYWSVRSS